MAKLPPRFAARKPTLPPLPTPRTHSLLAREDVVVDDDYTSTLADDYTSPLAVEEPRVHILSAPSTPVERTAPASTSVAPALPKVHTPRKAKPAHTTSAKPTVDKRTGERIEYTPVLGKRKRSPSNRNPRVTKRDEEILKAVHWMGRATTTHIAYAVDNVPHNIKSRLRDLVKRGLLLSESGDAMTVYGITKHGIQMIGLDDTPMAKPAPSTVAHRNKANTIILLFKLGSRALGEVVERDEASRQSVASYENRRKADMNAMLEREKERVRALAPAERSDADRRILLRKPASMIDLPTEADMTAHIRTPADSPILPEVAISERAIVKDANTKTSAGCVMDWEAECANFLNTVPANADAKTLEAAISHRTWIFNHWDSNKRFGETHRPDGVIIRPNRVDSNGEVRGGCIWIEMEDHRKPHLSDYKKVIMQAIDHPLVEAVHYFTPHGSIANMLKKAKQEVVKELVARDHSNRSHEQKVREATALVEASAPKPKKQPLINKLSNSSGFWG